MGGGQREKNSSKWKTKITIHHALYLRNSVAYDHDLWYNCVKWWWYLQGFFSFFRFVRGLQSIVSRILGQHPESSKKGTFWKVLPIYTFNKAIFGKKSTFLSNITRGSVQLPDTDFFSELFLGVKGQKMVQIDKILF